jgi:hypothetical protein
VVGEVERVERVEESNAREGEAIDWEGDAPAWEGEAPAEPSFTPISSLPRPSCPPFRWFEDSKCTAAVVFPMMLLLFSSDVKSAESNGSAQVRPFAAWTSVHA